jgi:hypothetical protein
VGRTVTRIFTWVSRDNPGYVRPQEAQPSTGASDLASTVNMKSGLRAMGALRPDGTGSEEPVALETAVIATGARPGAAGAKRELFTEETQTVLVFEKGAVIRLSAGVADGQLLFLTNKKSGKEVVTQVIRKRSFRPTSCYVDLEFTEASPGFWGIEFSKSAPVLPSQMSGDSDAEEGDDLVKHAAPPGLQEVKRLKKEVVELQTQLKTLTGSTPGSVSATSAPGAVSKGASTSEVAKPQHEESVLAQLVAQEAQQEELHGPKRLLAYPQKSTSSVVRAASKVATAGAIAAVIVAAGVAAYRFGLHHSFIAKSTANKPAPSKNSANLNSATPFVSKTNGVAVAPANSTAAGASRTTPNTLSSTTENGGSKAGSASVPASVEASGAPNTMPKEAKRHDGFATNSLGSNSVSATGIVPSSSSTSVAESSNAAPVEDYVAPKLIYSVKPVSPPDALRNYITGTVNVEALVDGMGHVKSVAVISGPQKLRNTAVAEMKQYVYEPARKGGKPVAAHVRASLKYWYEP